MRQSSIIFSVLLLVFGCKYHKVHYRDYDYNSIIGDYKHTDRGEFYNDTTFLNSCKRGVSAFCMTFPKMGGASVGRSVDFDGFVVKGKREGVWRLSTDFKYTLANITYKKGRISGDYILFDIEGRVIYHKTVKPNDSIPAYLFGYKERFIKYLYFKDGKVVRVGKDKLTFPPIEDNYSPVLHKQVRKYDYLITDKKKCKDSIQVYLPDTYKIKDGKYYDIYNTKDTTPITGFTVGLSGKYRLLKVFGNLKNGLKEGQWVYFEQNPNKCAKEEKVCVLSENYKAGVLHGRRTVYSLTGKVIHSTKFKNGSGYYKNYSSKGELLEEGTLKNGEKTADWIIHKAIPSDAVRCGNWGPCG